MENAVEALKIAAGVLLFVLALTLSISCFSQANNSVTAIVNMRDRDTQILYDQIKPSEGLTRIVGVETIVPTMYTALYENIDIFFKDSSGQPMPIYYQLDSNGRIEKNENDGSDKTIDYISGGIKEEFLDMILAVGKLNKNNYPDSDMVSKKENVFYYDKGFYDIIKDKNFEESLGEYYQIDSSTSGSTATQIKKRVITYQEQ